VDGTLLTKSPTTKGEGTGAERRILISSSVAWASSLDIKISCIDWLVAEGNLKSRKVGMQ